KLDDIEDTKKVYWLTGVYRKESLTQPDEDHPVVEETGTFAVRKEEDDDNVHVSGLWIGQTFPDPAIANQFVPINPIRWTISVLKTDNSEPSVFGTGYFEDS